MLCAGVLFSFAEKYAFGVDPLKEEARILCSLSEQAPAWKVTNDIVVNMALCDIIDSMTAEQICDAIELLHTFTSNFALAAPHIVNKLMSLVSPTLNLRDCKPLFRRLEYSYYQFRKRKWPVRRRHNIEWQQLALALGLTPRIYDPEHLPSLKKRIAAPTVADPQAVKEVIRNIEIDEGEINDNRIQDLKQRIRVGPTSKQTQRDIAREEKQRRLRTECNYGEYNVPLPEAWGHQQMVLRVFRILHMLNPAAAATYVSRLLISRSHFHCGIQLATLESSAIQLRYAIWMMLKEERLFGKDIPASSRAIVHENVFRALPIPTQETELQQSPYFAEVYTGDVRDLIPMYIGVSGRRPTTAAEFAERLSILAGGVLDGIDLATHDAFLTGSSLVPCIVTNPLESNFASFADYCEHHYPTHFSNASADEIKERIVSLREKVIDILRSHAFQSTSYMTNDLPNTPSYMLAAAVGLWADDHVIEMKNDELEMARYLSRELRAATEAYDAIPICDLDIGVTSLNAADYDKKCAALFKDIYDRLTEMHGTEPTPSEFYMQKVTTMYSHKWAFRGIKLKRSMDVFKTPQEPHTLMSTFHLNIVRSWWDGRELRMFASAVCAALTGVNQWYRWFSNNKDPISIVLKNMRRGYSTLLEPRREIPAMIEYIARKDPAMSPSFIVGKVHKTHSFFVTPPAGQRATEGILVNAVKNEPQNWEFMRCPHHKNGYLIVPEAV